MYYFRILSKKNAEIMNLKNPDLDLIWRIHSECGFFRFMIRFWILVKKKRKIRFWIQESGFEFSQKKRTLSLRVCIFLLSQIELNKSEG